VKWVIVGTDMFSHDSYPREVLDDERLCRASAIIYTEAQRIKQPGGMSDTFRCHTMLEAQHICDMTKDEITAFVEKVRG
jgi:hypothetical protein